MTGLRDPRRSGVVDPAFARDPAAETAVTVSPSLQSIQWTEAGQAGRSKADAPTAAAERTQSQQRLHHTEHSGRHGQSSQRHLSSLAIAAPRIMKAGLQPGHTRRRHTAATHTAASMLECGRKSWWLEHRHTFWNPRKHLHDVKALTRSHKGERASMVKGSDCCGKERWPTTTCCLRYRFRRLCQAHAAVRLPLLP